MLHPDFSSYPFSGYGEDSQTEDNTPGVWEAYEQEVDPDQTSWGSNRVSSLFGEVRGEVTSDQST